MGLIDVFLGATIAGLGALLMAVAFMARKRSGERKMAVLGAAFGAAAAGGAVLTLGELVGPPLLEAARALFAAAMLACLAILYAALFARAK